MSISRWQASQFARIIRAGGVISYPTEAVFGLGCDPLNPEAVNRILDLKARPVTKGLILIASDFWQLKPYLQQLPDAIETKILASWPGPTTWLVPALENVPYWLRGVHKSLAVRISDHPTVIELCRASGSALVSTSANPGGLPPARTSLAVRRYFHGTLDAMVAGSTGGQQRPSVIRDALTDKQIRV